MMLSAKVDWPRHAIWFLRVAIPIVDVLARAWFVARDLWSRRRRSVAAEQKREHGKVDCGLAPAQPFRREWARRGGRK
jgi:hypothetical protein